MSNLVSHLPGILIYGLLAGLLAGLLKGGLAYLRHYILYFLLWRSGASPWNYIRFLDAAAEQILLRKAGGGCIFLHRLLLDYFADLENASDPQVFAGDRQEIPPLVSSLPHLWSQLERMNMQMCQQYRSFPLPFSLTPHVSCRVGINNVPSMHAFVAYVANPFSHLLSIERNWTCFRFPCLENGL